MQSSRIAARALLCDQRPAESDDLDEMAREALETRSVIFGRPDFAWAGDEGSDHTPLSVDEKFAHYAAYLHAA